MSKLEPVKRCCYVNIQKNCQLRGQLSWPGEKNRPYISRNIWKRRRVKGWSLWAGNRGKTVSTEDNFRVERYIETHVLNLRSLWVYTVWLVKQMTTCPRINIQLCSTFSTCRKWPKSHWFKPSDGLVQSEWGKWIRYALSSPFIKDLHVLLSKAPNPQTCWLLYSTQNDISWIPRMLISEFPKCVFHLRLIKKISYQSSLSERCQHGKPDK